VCCLQLLKSTIATSLPALFQPIRKPSYDIDTDTQSLAAILPAALPDEQDYCNDVHMATVRSVSALFLHLLNGLKQSCSSESVVDTRHLLQPASVIMLSSCPISCYDLLVTYLQSSTAVKTHMVTSTDADCVEIYRFHSLLPDVVTGPVRALACHPNIAKLKEMTASVQPLSG